MTLAEYSWKNVWVYKKFSDGSAGSRKSFTFLQVRFPSKALSNLKNKKKKVGLNFLGELGCEFIERISRDKPIFVDPFFSGGLGKKIR